MIKQLLVISFTHEFVLEHVNPSLIGYHHSANFNYATWPYSRSINFDGELILQSIFHVISFVLEQQACFWFCVVPMVPITFCFIIPLTWCHHQSVTSSRNLSTNVSWSSSTFWGLPRYLSNSWWEIASFALDGLGYHPQHYCIPSNTNIVPVLCCTLSSLLSNLCYDSTAEYYHLWCQEGCGDCSTS